MFRPSVLLNCLLEQGCKDPLINAHCTSVNITWLVDPDDPLCLPIKYVAKCFTDGTETHEFIMPDGSTITDIGDPAVSNATPYSAPTLKAVEVKDELRNFHFVVPAAGFTGTVADLVALALAATPVAIQLPSETAPVAVTAAELCGWDIDVQPCFAELESGEIVPEGADFAFIGGLKATGDGDSATGGVDSTTTVNAPVEGTILTLCASFVRSEMAKA